MLKNGKNQEKMNKLEKSKEQEMQNVVLEQDEMDRLEKAKKQELKNKNREMTEFSCRVCNCTVRG